MVLGRLTIASFRGGPSDAYEDKSGLLLLSSKVSPIYRLV